MVSFVESVCESCYKPCVTQTCSSVLPLKLFKGASSKVFFNILINKLIGIRKGVQNTLN